MRPARGSLIAAVAVAASITPSGALSPGPLSASAVAAGVGLGVVGGVLVALGHLIVEAPYVLLVAKLFSAVEEKMKRMAPALNLVASAFTLYFAYLVGRDGLRLLSGDYAIYAEGAIVSPAAAVTAGIVLTGANAYFLAWWLTVGKPIIDWILRLPPHKSAIVYTVHYSYDLAWLALLAYIGGTLGAGGARILGAALVSLALILVYFAIKLALGGLWRREND